MLDRLEATVERTSANLDRPPEEMRAFRDEMRASNKEADKRRGELVPPDRAGLLSVGSTSVRGGFASGLFAKGLAWWTLLEMPCSQKAARPARPARHGPYGPSRRLTTVGRTLYKRGNAVRHKLSGTEQTF